MVSAMPGCRPLLASTSISSASWLPSPALGESRGGRRGQVEGIVQLAVGQQARVGGDTGAVELELEAAVERDPQRFARFTRRVRHPTPVLPILCP